MMKMLEFKKEAEKSGATLQGFTEETLKDFDDSDESSEDSNSENSGENEEDEEDEEKALMRELERIKKEREEEKKQKEREKKEEEEEAETEAVLRNNPLLNQGQTIKRKWYDETVFKNQARKEEKAKKRFINDTIRSDFHRNFLKKYVK